MTRPPGCRSRPSSTTRALVEFADQMPAVGDCRPGPRCVYSDWVLRRGSRRRPAAGRGRGRPTEFHSSSPERVLARVRDACHRARRRTRLLPLGGRARPVGASAGRRRAAPGPRPASAGRSSASSSPRSQSASDSSSVVPPASSRSTTRGQLGPGLLVAQLRRSLSSVVASRCIASAASRQPIDSRPARRRPGAPAARRPGRHLGRRRGPRAPSARCTMAYPRSRVAAGDSARSRARVWRELGAGAVEPVAAGCGRPASRSASTSAAALRRPSLAGGPAPAGSAARRAAAARGRAGAHAPGRSRLPGLADQADLLGEVGHDPLGGVGRRRGAHVGDEVDQRRVGLVADRADHRRAAGEHRPAQRLVGERQQVLDAAAAAGQDDHVDASRRGRARASASMICGTAVGPCTATLTTRNSTAGQRRRALSSTSRSAALARPVIRPIRPGRNGSRRLRAGSNRPSAASSFLSCSSRASSSPRPTWRISSARRLQRAPGGVELRLGVHAPPGRRRRAPARRGRGRPGWW